MSHNSLQKITKPLRVAMIAPPWLAIPIEGYGGIELVLENLIAQLKNMNVEVTLFANGERAPKGITTYSLYKKEVYSEIFKPLNESVYIVNAHLQFAINRIIEDGGFDIVHNHIEFVGTQVLNALSHQSNFPPVIHTHHGPPFLRSDKAGDSDVMPFWQELGVALGSFYIVGISDALMTPAPHSLKPHILRSVYNAIDCHCFPFVSQKKNYFYTMARFNEEKAQHIAAKLCAKNGFRLRMAGTIAGIESNRKLLAELANPMSSIRGMKDFRYYSDKILPYTIKYRKITYSGNLSGRKKMKFMSEAKALLFPIQWDEPFGMAVIEALACGTPVIAMNRGAMSEIIEHGVNGFLAETEEEFEEYMHRIDEIDPRACRKSVEKKFGAETMARSYLDRYHEVIAKSQGNK